MTSKKNRSMIWIYPVLIVLGGAFVYFVTKYNKETLENAPKLDYEHSIDSLYVGKISFGRGNFRVNGIIYNAFGISSYSKIHHESESFDLYKLPPPFILFKEANNDTLEIIKDDKRYYLLISEERRLW